MLGVWLLLQLDDKRQYIFINNVLMAYSLQYVSTVCVIQCVMCHHVCQCVNVLMSMFLKKIVPYYHRYMKKI